MQVLAHPDPHVLERELLERVARERESAGLRPVLVLVPTARLRDHVRGRLAERCGALLNVHVEHYTSFCYRVLDHVGVRAPRVVSRMLQRVLIEHQLGRERRGPLAPFVRRRPGALTALRKTINDLREAGLKPDALDAGGDGMEGGIARLFAGYSEALAAHPGLTDKAGLVELALPHVERLLQAQEFAAVVHHGAYELIGVHLDLLRAVDRSAELVFLLPCEPGTAVTAYAERFAKRHLQGEGSGPIRLDDAAGGLLGTRLRGLYDEESSVAPLDGAQVTLLNVQGADGEATYAMRRALEYVREGTAPERIAIVARNLDPYLARCEATARDTAAPWGVFGAAPLRRDPLVHDLLLILRTVRDDFPRAATVELLRSPRIRWSALQADPPQGDLAESFSRTAQLTGGLAGWTEELQAWAETRDDRPAIDEQQRVRRERRRAWLLDVASRVGQAVQRIHDAVNPEPRRWSEHAARLSEMLGTWLRYDGADAEGVLDTLRGVLDEMRDIETLTAQRGDVPFERLVAWLERCVDETPLELGSKDRGGVRVLDAMQARGLTFDRVLLMGMNESMFPSLANEDPFVGDETRRRLSRETGRPLTVSGERDQEEHLLLALLLGAASDSLSVSWQRADDRGLTRAPSMALREIARIVHGRADLGGLLSASDTLSAHPSHWLEQLAERAGGLTPEEERTLIALRSRRPEDARLALADDPQLVAGLTMLCATESFEARSLEYDGRVGTGVAPDCYSVTALESLGRCPLQFFFAHVLRVEPLDDESRPFEIEARERGTLAHDVLERLYRRLMDEGLFGAGELERRVARGAELLPEVWAEVMTSLSARVGRRLPGLWQHLEQLWLGTLGAFVEQDLRRLAEAGMQIAQVEQQAEQVLDFGDGVRLRVRGRLDRILRGAEDREWVGDYKTGRVKDRTNITQMLKGRTLQVPLYWALADSPQRIELLGIGPQHDPELTERESRYEAFDGFQDDAQQNGFQETMRVLSRLPETGAFPLCKDNHCSWCPYESACRHAHFPTRERESAAADGADFHDVREKAKRGKRTLAEVRDQRPAGRR